MPKKNKSPIGPAPRDPKHEPAPHRNRPLDSFFDGFRESMDHLGENLKKLPNEIISQHSQGFFQYNLIREQALRDANDILKEAREKAQKIVEEANQIELDARNETVKRTKKASLWAGIWKWIYNAEHS